MQYHMRVILQLLHSLFTTWSFSHGSTHFEKSREKAGKLSSSRCGSTATGDRRNAGTLSSTDAA
jgi:hypothetical protein